MTTEELLKIAEACGMLRALSQEEEKNHPIHKILKELEVIVKNNLPKGGKGYKAAMAVIEMVSKDRSQDEFFKKGMEKKMTDMLKSKYSTPPESTGTP